MSVAESTPSLPSLHLQTRAETVAKTFMGRLLLGGRRTGGCRKRLSVCRLLIDGGRYAPIEQLILNQLFVHSCSNLAFQRRRPAGTDRRLSHQRFIRENPREPFLCNTCGGLDYKPDRQDARHKLLLDWRKHGSRTHGLLRERRARTR